MCNASEMEMVNPQPLQARPYWNGEDQLQQIPLPVERGNVGAGIGADVGGGREESLNGVEEESRNSPLRSRTSELTVAFEGEVYVFPAVTPEKVGFLYFSGRRLFVFFLVLDSVCFLGKFRMRKLCRKGGKKKRSKNMSFTCTF